MNCIPCHFTVFCLPCRSKIYPQHRDLPTPPNWKLTPLCSVIYDTNGCCIWYGNHVRRWSYLFLGSQKVGWPHAVSPGYKWIVLFECDCDATWIRPPRNAKLNERCFQHLIRCACKWKQYTNRLGHLYSKESNDTNTHNMELLVKGSH